MNPPSVKFGLAAALALAAPLAAALPEDRNQPIHLEASRGQLDQKTGISVYEGNVVITQGSMRLTADTVTIYVKDNNFQRMEATGAPANLRYRPTADKPEIQGASQRVEYDVARRQGHHERRRQADPGAGHLHRRPGGIRPQGRRGASARGRR